MFSLFFDRKRLGTVMEELADPATKSVG
jgi:hypothetical protein